MRIEKYGAGGEKLSQAQMELFELAPVVSEAIMEAENASLDQGIRQASRSPGVAGESSSR